MRISPLIDRLIESLQVLPGRWSKDRNADRSAHVLQYNRPGAVAPRIGANGSRRERPTLPNMPGRLPNPSNAPFARNPRRDGHMLCIVESPSDFVAIEQAAGFSGRYYVPPWAPCRPIRWHWAGRTRTDRPSVPGAGRGRTPRSSWLRIRRWRARPRLISSRSRCMAPARRCRASPTACLSAANWNTSMGERSPIALQGRRTVGLAYRLRIT